MAFSTQLRLLIRTLAMVASLQFLACSPEVQRAQDAASPRAGESDAPAVRAIPLVPLVPAAPAAAAVSASPAVPEAPPAPVTATQVEFKTNLGAIVIELDFENAPVSAKNFLRYVQDGFYDGTIFHRVMPGFVIQGGGFTPDMVQKPPREPITNEWCNGVKNSRGTLSMARLGGRPDSATSQFFINVVDNDALDQARDGAAYAVFGHVVSGMDVVDEIAGVRTGSVKGHRDVPTIPIVVESATVVGTTTPASTN